MGVHAELETYVCFCMTVTLCITGYLGKEDQPVIAIIHLVSHFVLNSNDIERIRNVLLCVLQMFYCSHINPQCIQNPNCPFLKLFAS